MRRRLILLAIAAAAAMALLIGCDERPAVVALTGDPWDHLGRR